jgi:hypothetical protein
MGRRLLCFYIGAEMYPSRNMADFQLFLDANISNASGVIVLQSTFYLDDLKRVPYLLFCS